MALVPNEYMWAVTYNSRDDGHRLVAAYFKERSDADLHCKQTDHGIDQQVVQTTLWQEDGRWYVVSQREVEVDEPLIRKRAISKLSEEEKRVLGIG